MSIERTVRLVAVVAVCAASQFLAKLPAAAQLRGGPVFRVSGKSERLEMIINTSRILTLDYNVPRIVVQNQDILQATPLSPNQVQVFARRTGVTSLNLWDEKGDVYTVDVVVTGDARELQQLLALQYPEAELHVRPLNQSVVISGYVPSADMVSPVIRIAEDYYPSVINAIRVGGVQQIALKVKVLEVSRTKLRALGFDWAQISGNNFIVQNVAGVIGAVTSGGGSPTGSGTQTVSFGIVDGSNAFFGFLEALQQKNLVKVMAEPVLTTTSGRPATFHVGGEFPVIVPQSLGTVSIEYREFGTRLDFVPIVLGNGSLRLEVRPAVSEIDPARSVTVNGITVPGLRTRWVDTGIEMQVGQTFALAGLIQNRVEAENRGFPILADMPWIGAAFRRVQEQNNEIELLITVTPEFVEGMDAHEVPPGGPGQGSAIPNNTELMMRGYMEVPSCGPNGYVPATEPGDGPPEEAHAPSLGVPHSPIPGASNPSSSSRPSPDASLTSQTRRRLPPVVVRTAAMEPVSDPFLTRGGRTRVLPVVPVKLLPPTIIGPVGYEKLK